MIALAGQPNGGKSTVFNALTGAKQFVANYPGVTVEKMSGWYTRQGQRVEVIDLPGTYSLTSYSPEERVTRSALLSEPISTVVNVVDASNLKRGLYLTLQLLEMGVPVLLALNMMDVARKKGMSIDTAGLSESLGVPIVETTMRTGQGKAGLLEAIDAVAVRDNTEMKPVASYPEIENEINQLVAVLADDEALRSRYRLSWLAVKLLEGDAEVETIVRTGARDAMRLLHIAQQAKESFVKKHGQKIDVYVSVRRNQQAAEIAEKFTSYSSGEQFSRTEGIDKIICHRFLGPIILLGIIYMIYHLSIVEGYKITGYTWPLLAWGRSLIESVLPAQGFITTSLLRDFVLWCTDSVIALLNYIPIFFILFGLIAILEDSGYMPRMAFIMDRLLNRFGLHGQSTLPMVLSGAVVGGCVVPGVMSTKAIPDEKSRLATILTLPMLNCLAKVPLYILLINAYFVDARPQVMFFISTISLLFVLPMAKLLSVTLLKGHDSAPFIMELPPYHLPTARGILGRALERVWLFVRKIVSVVAAVAVVLFIMLQFPGVDQASMQGFEARKDKSVATFLVGAKNNPLATELRSETDVFSLIRFYENYRQERRKATDPEALIALNQKYQTQNPKFFEIITSKKTKNARDMEKGLRAVVLERQTIILEMREKRIENSILGSMGRGLESITQYAGFNWRVNIAVLSSLAAKESTVATLGALYQETNDDKGTVDSPEKRMAAQETGFTPLHAVALMIFMILCPPCIPTAVSIRIQTGSTKWMLFSFFYPLALGLLMATLVFSGGKALGLNGLQAMWAFYLIPLTLTILVGLFSRDVEHKKTRNLLQG